MAHHLQNRVIGVARSHMNGTDFALPVTLAESQPKAREEPGIAHIK